MSLLKMRDMVAMKNYLERSEGLFPEEVVKGFTFLVITDCMGFRHCHSSHILQTAILNYDVLQHNHRLCSLNKTEYLIYGLQYSLLLISHTTGGLPV